MAKKKSKNKIKANKISQAHKTKLSRKAYEAKLFKLHAELVKLQQWVKEKGLKIGLTLAWRSRNAAFMPA